MSAPLDLAAIEARASGTSQASTYLLVNVDVPAMLARIRDLESVLAWVRDAAPTASPENIRRMAVAALERP